MLLDDIKERRKRHFQHHQYAGTDLDPNVETFRAIGMTPVLSKRRFMYYCCFPVTPGGVWNTIRNVHHSVKRRTQNQRGLLGVVVFACMGILFSLGVLANGLVVFVVARLFIYPWLSWISSLVEHRWFVDTGNDEVRVVECHVGRPTVYKGVTGALVRAVLFPYGDSYHLAHSLYPGVQYNFLPYVNSYCFATVPKYAEHYSVGLLLPGHVSRPSALSELYYTMTKMPGAIGNVQRCGRGRCAIAALRAYQDAISQSRAMLNTIY